MVDTVKNKYGSIDYLINAAGVNIHGQFSKLDERDWDEVIDINLKGVFLCCKAVWPIMTQQKESQILTISSASGLNSYPTGTIYCASKAGLNSFMDALTLEASEVGIKVTNICPGQIDTPMWNLNDGEVNNARKYMLSADSIASLVDYVLTRPWNEQFKNLTLFPYEIKGSMQLLLRSKNRGPGGKFPTSQENN